MRFVFQNIFTKLHKKCGFAEQIPFIMSEFTYSKKKQICPCGQSTSYTPLTSHSSGGKCHSTKCGQQFFPPEPQKNGIPETVYQYRDEQGNILFETVRYYKNGEKSFYQRRPINGQYVKGLADVRRVLYNLPDIQKALAEQREIFVVEGEKDAENLKRQGLVATCNPMGAGKWQKAYSQMLKNANVIIIPDNDDAGKLHGDDVARHLHNTASSVRLVNLPELPPKGDVSDWFQQGNTVQKLLQICAETPLYEPNLHSPAQIPPSHLKTPTNDLPQAVEPIKTITLAQIMAIEMPPIEWIIDGLLALGSFNVIAARPKQGKSWLALAMALSVSGGNTFMGRFQALPSEALYFDLESSQRRIKQRAGIILANSNDSRNLAGLHIATQIPRMDKGGLEALKLTLQGNKNIKLVIIDTWARFWGTRRGVNAYSEDYDEGAKLQEIAKELNVAIVVVHHTKKTPEEYAIDELSGTTGITAAADTIFMLRRKGENTIFHCTGRDIASQDYAVQFDEKQGQWKILGSALEAAISAERSLLLQFLKDYERPLKTGELANMTQKTVQATRNMLFKLKEQGIVRSPSYGMWEYIRQEQAF